MTPFVRNLLILAAVAVVIVLLNLEVAVVTVGLLLRIAFIIAIAVVAYFYWRDFANRRQVGGYLGLGGTEHSSGAERRELGISKAGNRRARFVLIEAAWLWLEHQPNSPLTSWFHKHAPKGAPARQRRIAIVGLARKLAVVLWRYLSDGVVPEGAVMKA